MEVFAAALAQFSVASGTNVAVEYDGPPRQVSPPSFWSQRLLAFLFRVHTVLFVVFALYELQIV